LLPVHTPSLHDRTRRGPVHGCRPGDATAGFESGRCCTV
jgi:hypothetical protein